MTDRDLPNEATRRGNDLAPAWNTSSVPAPAKQLEQMIRDELRGPIEEIVRRLVPELVAEALNGAAPRVDSDGPQKAQEATNAPVVTPEPPSGAPEDVHDLRVRSPTSVRGRSPPVQSLPQRPGGWPLARAQSSQQRGER